MKKSSKGLEYARGGAGACVLHSGEKCKDAEVIIPEKGLFERRVIRIGDYAFANNTRIKSVFIPEGVASIGPNAFENCTNLETVFLPQSLKTIGSRAFARCEKLNNIVLPSTVSFIFRETFAHCYSLESLDLRHICSIGERAFEKCVSLVDVAVSDKLKKVHASSFLGSKYYMQRSKQKGIAIYLGKWLIGYSGYPEEYVIAKDTIGIATDLFVNGHHIKHTKNPQYDAAEKAFWSALECSSLPLPPVPPEYFEELVPAKICYEGTLAEWNNIIKLPGEKRIPAMIIAEDATIETFL